MPPGIIHRIQYYALLPTHNFADAQKCLEAKARTNLRCSDARTYVRNGCQSKGSTRTKNAVSVGMSDMCTQKTDKQNFRDTIDIKNASEQHTCCLQSNTPAVFSCAGNIKRTNPALQIKSSGTLLSEKGEKILNSVAHCCTPSYVVAL